MSSALDMADVVGRIYDAALSGEQWRDLPRIFMQVADGSSAVIALFRSRGAPEIVTCEQPEEAGQQYAAYYRLVNPLDPIMARLGPMQVRRNTDLMPVVTFRQTEFYTDFAHRVGTEHLMGTNLVPLAPGVVGDLGVHRAGSREFRGRDAARLQRLLPHFQRALQLRLRLGLSDAAPLGFAALEHLAVACIICDAAGQIIFANPAAEALETRERVVTLNRRRGIGSTDPAEARRLAALIADAARGGSGGPMRLVAPNGAEVFALVAPLAARLGHHSGHALVTMRSSRAAASYDASMLRELFGLTPAEASLSLALVAGASLGEIAVRRAVSENTLRSHLSSVLHKTGVATQRDLVRLLGLVPPLAVNTAGAADRTVSEGAGPGGDERSR